MNTKQAVLSRYAEPQWEPVMARTSVHVEPAIARGPKPVVGHSHEHAHHGPRQPEADETDLTAVGVPRQHQIRIAGWQVLEGTRIVQERYAKVTRLTRQSRRNALQVFLAVSEDEVVTDDLNWARLRLDERLLVDEKRRADVRERAADDGRSFVIVVAETTEDATGQSLERLERAREQ